MIWNNIKTKKDFLKFYKTSFEKKLKDNYIVDTMYNISKIPIGMHPMVYIGNPGNINFFLSMTADKTKNYIVANIIDVNDKEIKSRFKCENDDAVNLFKLFVYTNPDAQIIVDISFKHPFVVKVSHDNDSSKNEMFPVSLNILKKIRKMKNIKCTFGQTN